MPDGRLAFGGVHGLNLFDPKEILSNEFMPNVLVTNVLVNNQPIVPGDASGVLTQTIETATGITLTHLQDILTLEFAALDFSAPLQNKYRYQLVGADDQWVESGTRRMATYLHLPAGDYTFRVQGSNSRGVWSEHLAELKIKVLPPWWRSWWAYLLYALAAGGAIYFFRKKELRERELRHRLELEKVAGEKLKELDSFKSRLYTNLTHEFRTPLTVILDMAQQTRKDIELLGYWDIGKAPPPPISQYPNNLISSLTTIERNGKSLLQLINQLLDLSKLENNALQLHPEQRDIVPYLRYVTESFQTYANSRNLSLRFFTRFESLVMDFDLEQVKQVLTNLISNALKFTPPGGEVTVKLEIEKLEIGKFAGSSNFPIPQFLISISDTGIGIAEKDLPHIFDRFYQADSSTTREREGTGIGLAHAQELVRFMGGSISVKSEVGKGTAFIVSLPVTNKAAVASDGGTRSPPATLMPHPSDGVTRSHGITSANAELPHLLIIEDNADVVNYLQTCLAGTYQTQVARNGRIGVEMALEHIPDLIVTDVMMPEKDGYQVCDELKNDERTSHVPVIILTARADAASRMTGLRRGADAYLAKPFDVEELLVQVELLLSNQQRIAAHFSKTIQTEMVAAAPEPALVEAVGVEDVFLQKVRSIIAANYSSEDFALPQLCRSLGMSRSQLFRKLKAVADTTPADLIRSHRLRQAKSLLESSSLAVSEVAWKVGFKDISHFSRAYQEEFGCTPSGTRK